MQLARMDKPIGTWLLYLPCTWSIAMATYSSAIPISSMAWTLGLFGAGALVMRGAGCTINDMWDVEFDKKVERTQSRPLASGALSMNQATAFLSAQLLLGLGVLVQLNPYSMALGASSLALVGTYPLMKRITYWPQAFLGLTFNYGALLGWAAMLGACQWNVVLPLYFAGVCWTLVYDTIYAIQDMQDDVVAGVKSTALRFGQSMKAWLAGFATLSLGFFGLAGYNNDQGWPYYAGLTGAAMHYAWQLSKLQLGNAANAWNIFSSNRRLGYMIFIGIVADIIRTR